MARKTKTILKSIKAYAKTPEGKRIAKAAAVAVALGVTAFALRKAARAAAMAGAVGAGTLAVRKAVKAQGRAGAKRRKPSTRR
jgi:hypothetical protein